MSGLTGLILVAVSVGLSNFAGAIGIGLSGVSAKMRIRVGILFGLFEAGMPIVGLIIGMSVAGRLGHIGTYVGAALLVLTGLYTIIQARRQKSADDSRETEEERSGISTRQLAITAVALSLDNLVVGFALGVYHVNLVLAAAVMGVVSVGMALLGLELGSRLGRHVEEWAEELGGAVLIGVGLALGSGLLK